MSHLKGTTYRACGAALPTFYRLPDLNGSSKTVIMVHNVRLFLLPDITGGDGIGCLEHRSDNPCPGEGPSAVSYVHTTCLR